VAAEAAWCIGSRSSNRRSTALTTSTTSFSWTLNAS
jgi:hypothetical protein